MPAYEMVERHHTRVAAPAALGLGSGMQTGSPSRPLVRTILGDVGGDPPRDT
jgi:hypothetical protein